MRIVYRDDQDGDTPSPCADGDGIPAINLVFIRQEGDVRPFPVRIQMPVIPDDFAEVVHGSFFDKGPSQEPFIKDKNV